LVFDNAQITLVISIVFLLLSLIVTAHMSPDDDFLLSKEQNVLTLLKVWFSVLVFRLNLRLLLPRTMIIKVLLVTFGDVINTRYIDFSNFLKMWT